MPNIANFPRLREFNNAREFISALRITNEEFSRGSQWQSAWVFRGQSNADWSLLPSAWRPIENKNSDSHAINFIKHQKEFDGNRNMRGWEEILAEFWDEHKPLGDDKELDKRWENTLKVLHQAHAEVRSVHMFAYMASELGYTIESFETEIFMHDYLANLYSEDSQNDNIWMSDIVALVQHHGIPTRLLDWTNQPQVAAFFAAEGVEDNSLTQDSKIAVYAYGTFDPNGRIKIKKLPRSKSTYLHAQSGLFTYDSEADDWYIEHGSWPSLEDALLKKSEVIHGESKGYAILNLDRLVKFTLPATEAGELLRLLWIEGVSRAHLMPTLDNVANALKKQMYWAEKQNPKRVNRIE